MMNEVLEQDNSSVVDFFRREANFALFVFSGEYSAEIRNLEKQALVEINEVIGSLIVEI